MEALMHREQGHRKRMSPLAGLIAAVLVIAMVTLVLSLIHGSWYPGTW